MTANLNKKTIANTRKNFSAAAGRTSRRSVPALRLMTMALLMSAALVQQLAAQPGAFQQAGRRERIRTLVTKPHLLQAADAEPHDHSDDDAHEHDHDDANRCVELNGMSVLYKVGASVDDIVDDLAPLPDNELFAAFQPHGSRWTNTATNGFVAQGQRMTLTYSFVPDGTPLSVVGYGQGTSNLLAQLDANFPGGRAAWKAKFAQAFNSASWLTNIEYVEVGDDGAAFPSSPGALGARGDIRIAMMPLGTPLAVNFYPQFGGDMVLDSQDIADFINPANDYRALRNVLMHEHGHGLGLRHVDPANGTKLMEPFLVTSFDGPQEDDIRAVHFLYGDWAEPNAGYGEELFVGGPLNTPVPNDPTILRVENVSLERAGESDFYGFTAFAGVPIAVRVDPIGTSYEQGPQDGATSIVNAKAVRNLGLRLYRRISAATGELAMLAQIDFNAAGQSEYHPPITYTQAGYMLAEVYSTDGVNDVQRYQLTISNAAIAAPVEPSSMSVFNVAAGQQIFVGSTVQFGQVNIGNSSNVTLTIGNGGPGALEIGQITLAGPGAGDYNFSLIGNPVQSGGTASLAISFQPSAAGARQAVMTLPNNDPSQPNFSFILNGSGVQPTAPAIEVSINDVAVTSNASVDFGEVELGQSELRSIRIRNTGSAPLNVTNVTIVGTSSADFSSTLTTASIAPGGSVTGTLTFSPQAADLRQAQLRIFSNAQPSPFSLTMTGNGLEPVSNDDEEDVDSDVDQNEDEDESGDEDLPPQGNTLVGGGLCGIGSAMPMMLGILGLCGMGISRHRR